MARSISKPQSTKLGRYPALLLWLCVSGTAFAQLFTVDAGQGMAGQPSGAAVSVDFGTWTTEGSIGYYNSSAVGGVVARKQVNPNWSAAVGDQTLQVGLPTQIEFSSQVLALGLSTTYSPDPAIQMSAFAGVAGNGYFSTNLFYAPPDIPLGALAVDYSPDARRRVKLFTRALVSNRQTLLTGLLYQTSNLETGLSLGIASNQPHAEGLFRYVGTQWTVRERYLLTGNHFELLTLPQFRTAQERGQNLDLSWTPAKEEALNFSQHEYLEPTGSAAGASGAVPTTFERGSIESGGAVLSSHQTSFGAQVYQSRFDGAYGSAASAFSSQKLSRRFFFNENYYRSLHTQNPTATLVLTAGENLNRRVTLAEYATQANGHWTLNYGGTLRWDRFDLNVGYSTTYVPLAPGGGRFQQSLDVSGHVNVGRWQVAVNTYVQPDGRVLYGYEIKSFYLHPMANDKVHAPSSAAPDFPEFLIEGHVLLADSRKPVANVPVAIASETVYTDDTGSFSLRVSRKHTYKVKVVTDQPIDHLFYEAIPATGNVLAGTDDAPGKVDLLVRLDAIRPATPSKEGVVIGNR